MTEKEWLVFRRWRHHVTADLGSALQHAHAIGRGSSDRQREDLLGSALVLVEAAAGQIRSLLANPHPPHPPRPTPVE